MSKQTTVVNAHSYSEEQVDEGGFVPQQIVLNNCLDVHIGPKYVSNKNITINQGVAEGDKEIVYNQGNNNPLYHVLPKSPYGVHVKAALFVVSLLLVALIAIPTLLMKSTNPKPVPRLPGNSEDYPLDKGFVAREAWGAAPPCDVLSNNTLPVERVIFIHTVSSGTCNNYASCKLTVLDIQDMHRDECQDIDSALGDIGYNFVIGSSGHIFVGRGWDVIGAHTYGSNTGSLGVAFIGDFRRDEPNQAMLQSAKTLLEVGVARGKLSEGYRLFGHCQVHSGFPYSPGVNVMRRIQSWPHWNSTNYGNCVDFVPSES